MMNRALLLMLLIGIFMPIRNSYPMQDNSFGKQDTAIEVSPAVNQQPREKAAALYRDILWANWGRGYVFREGAGLAHA